MKPPHCLTQKLQKLNQLPSSWTCALEVALDALLEFLFFFTKKFGKKRPILDKHKKNLSVWTSRFELVHCDWAVYFLTKPKLAFFTNIFY
jgi:hypothetical protein